MATLLEAAGNAGVPTLLSQASAGPDRLASVVGAPTQHGACFGAVILRPHLGSAQGGGPRPTPLDAGFRPRHTPPALRALRYLRNAASTRATVERVDASWIHGRDQDPRRARLQAGTVTILGAGSIGAAVAVLLAQAGVGRLRIVDDDVLKAANISRHPLGAGDLGRRKATALAAHIRSRFPHLRLDAADVRWEDLPPEFGLFANSDLIVSAMGSWVAESELNAAHLAVRSKPPILYTWTEAHAAAGHAAVIGSDSGCLRCGIDAVGSFGGMVTSWPANNNLRQEPACGAVYQPYGAAELGHITSMAAELAIERLLDEVPDSVHRVWVGPVARLIAAGGQLTEPWEKQLSASSRGAGFEKSWPLARDCPACHASAAAA